MRGEELVFDLAERESTARSGRGAQLLGGKRAAYALAGRLRETEKFASRKSSPRAIS